MKILVLCEGDAETRDSWSGTSFSVVQNLRALGHEVACGDVDLTGLDRLGMIARSWSPDRKRWWVKYHLDSAPFMRRSARAAHHIQRERDVDVILQFGGTFAPVGRGSTPLVLYCDGNIELAWQGRTIGNNDAAVLSRTEVDRISAREAAVYRDAGAILTISERLRTSFIDDFHIPASRITTVYAGPNFDPHKLEGLRPPESRPPTILFIGRQFARKGGDLLLRAFQLVRMQVPGARLVVVGPRDLKLTDPGVEYRGFINKDTAEGEQELLRLYAEAHVYCMPSRFEGFAISFLEAMAAGLPCVSTLPPWSPPEMIVDGETGFTVPPEDAEALAEKLVLLLQRPALARELGSTGRLRFHRHFTWPAVARRMEEVLYAVTGNESQPSGTAREHEVRHR